MFLKRTDCLRGYRVAADADKDAGFSHFSAYGAIARSSAGLDAIDPIPEQALFSFQICRGTTD
jgi:hypothetical protein